jgi:hypothetical protein
MRLVVRAVRQDWHAAQAHRHNTGEQPSMNRRSSSSGGQGNQAGRSGSDGSGSSSNNNGSNSSNGGGGGVFLPNEFIFALGGPGGRPWGRV